MIVIQGDYMEGREFALEGTLEDVFGETNLGALPGVVEAMQAADMGNYSNIDAPFYYGRIVIDGSRLGYIISHEDLYGS